LRTGAAIALRPCSNSSAVDAHPPHADPRHLRIERGGVGDGVRGVRGQLAGEGKARRREAEQRSQRFQDAIAAGVDPTALVEPMNQAQAEKAAAQAEIDAASKQATPLDVAEIYAMIDSLGDVGATLADARPTAVTRLYRELNVSAVYQPDERAVDVTARPRVDSACVRGGSCVLTTRIALV
jgi:hypothetical protein